MSLRTHAADTMHCKATMSYKIERLSGFCGSRFVYDPERLEPFCFPSDGEGWRLSILAVGRKWENPALVHGHLSAGRTAHTLSRLSL